jgi:hypothetical protein
LLDYSNRVVDSGGFNASLEPDQKGFVKPLTFGVLDKGTYTLSVDAVSPDGSIKLHEDIYVGIITSYAAQLYVSNLANEVLIDKI